MMIERDEANLVVVATKLTALTKVVDEGFQRMDRHYDEMSNHVTELRIWRAKVESQPSGDKGVDWQKIVIGLIALVALSLQIASGLIGKL